MSAGARRDSDDEGPAGILRKGSSGLCHSCSQSCSNLQTCGRCKAVKYCSRKCQKEDWSKHKEFCGAATEVGLKSICKFLNRLYSNLSLSLYLEIAILQKIRSKKLELSPDKAFKAFVLVGIEPVDIGDFGKLVTIPAFSEEGDCPLGMLQVLSIIIDSRPPVSVRDNPEYAPARQYFDSQPGHSLCPLVILDVVYYSGRASNPHYSLTHPISISAQAFFMTSVYNSLDIPSPNSNADTDIKKPMTPDTCMEYINMHIRQDHDNKYRLRRQMNREDMRSIHKAIQQKSDKFDFLEFLTGWIAKVVHEDVYTTHTEDLRSLIRVYYERSRLVDN